MSWTLPFSLPPSFWLLFWVYGWLNVESVFSLSLFRVWYLFVVDMASLWVPLAENCETQLHCVSFQLTVTPCPGSDVKYLFLESSQLIHYLSILHPCHKWNAEGLESLISDSICLNKMAMLKWYGGSLAMQSLPEFWRELYWYPTAPVTCYHGLNQCFKTTWGYYFIILEVRWLK